MYLNPLLLHNPSLNKKLGHVIVLIALELDYLVHNLVLHNIIVATKLLLDVLEYILIGEILLQAQHRSQALLLVLLLDMDIHIPFSS